VRHRLAKSRSRLSCHPNNLCASNPVPPARRGIADRDRIKFRKPVCFKRSKQSDREPEICGARVEWCQDHARLITSWRHETRNRADFFASQQALIVNHACAVASRRIRATAAARSRSRRSRTWCTPRLERACGCFGAYRSPPASIAPRQIPPATRRHCTRHQVKAARASRVAAAQPRQRHPTAGPQSKSRDRLVGIVRTRRQMAAMHADQR
jgi:hypothetical protein